MAAMAKDEICCLFCKNDCNESYFQVFRESQTSSGRSILPILRQLAPEPLTDLVFPCALCSECHSLVEEMDGLQSRLSEIKKTLKKSDEDEEMSLMVVKKLVKPKMGESSKSINVPKKILDIPSSDDDSTQPIAPHKVNYSQSIEDIEMELVKIHGGMSGQSEKQFSESDQMNVESEITADNAESLQSESETEADLESTLNSKSNENTIKVKMESDEYGGVTEKPNILKKKSVPSALDEDNQTDFKSVSDGSIVTRSGHIYTCMLCQGDETVAGEAKGIIGHLKMEHNVRLYICDICGMDFRKRNELSAHVDEHVAKEDGDFQCEICNRIFNNLRLFRIHRRMHIPQSKAWECKTCGKKYSSKNLLEEHTNTHLGVRPYVCAICGKDFASKYTFRAHERTHEVRPRPYNCATCQKSFLTQQNLSQHERIHLGMKEFSCHLCGKQFGSAHNLEVHSIVHTGYKPFVCGLCGKAFARKAEIRDHERTHTGERPYQCEFCGATFSQRSNLQSHKRATHYDDKRYRCEDCGKGFKRRRLLDYHVKAAHTGERPFKCDVCEATFVYPEHFKKHRRIHTGEKPYSCEVCGKAFNSRDNRNAHRFVHSDKKPYECLVCAAGFMRKPLLYQHMQMSGHLNDTIVVNQPRLSNAEDDIIETDSPELVAADNNSTDSPESKLYIAGTDGNEHIIIDGQQISFMDNESEEGEEDENGTSEIATIIEEDDQEIEEIISTDALSTGETQIIETPDGPVQLVKVRIPNDDGEEEEAWIKIVPE